MIKLAASPDDDEHRAGRETLRALVAGEREPFAADWDKAGACPRKLQQRAAEIGLIPVGFPEGCGGIEADPWMHLIGAQAWTRGRVGGLGASLMSHAIGTPPIARATQQV